MQIIRRGNLLAILGDARERASEVLARLYVRAETVKGIEPGDIDATVRMGNSGNNTGTRDGDQIEMFKGGTLEIKTRKKTVEPRTLAQQGYVASLYKSELAFGIGPAGTGKTYLAVAVAVNQMINGKVDKIILSRPAVEAGERLGFLPGDMKEKVAFMRGRTLSNAFVVLDEAQNATSMQMKMFLTRLGQGSRMVITGDRTQVDLPRGTTSGLADAERILEGIPGVAFNYFTAKDVVRHRLVGKIIEAYEKDAAPNSTLRN